MQENEWREHFIKIIERVENKIERVQEQLVILDKSSELGQQDVDMRLAQLKVWQQGIELHLKENDMRLKAIEDLQSEHKTHIAPFATVKSVIGRLLIYAVASGIIMFAIEMIMRNGLKS